MTEEKFIKIFVEPMGSSEPPLGATSLAISILGQMKKEKGGTMIVLNSYIREKIAEKHHVTPQAVKKELSKLTRQNVLEKIAVNTYRVNDKFFGVGN